MKTQLKTTALCAALLLTAVGAAQAAGFKGGSSNTTLVNVGESDVNGGPHVAGRAGIAVNSTGINTQVDFQGLSLYSVKTNSYVSGDIDGTANNLQQVNKLSYPYSYDPENAPGHTSLGVFNYVKVGASDLYFGEWSPSGSATDPSRTVYFIGANGDDSIATANRGTSATYNVVGVNRYDSAANSGAGNLLSGTFSATFNAGGTGSLTGSLTNASGFAVNIGTASILADASISGSGASATQGAVTLGTGGTVSGQFYNDQAALAGLVKFTGLPVGTLLDTSFGGTRN